jgi:hypothetical protein
MLAVLECAFNNNSGWEMKTFVKVAMLAAFVLPYMVSYGQASSINPSDYFAHSEASYGSSGHIFLSKKACPDENEAARGWKKAEVAFANKASAKHACWFDNGGNIALCYLRGPTLISKICEGRPKGNYVDSSNLPQPTRF